MDYLTRCLPWLLLGLGLMLLSFDWLNSSLFLIFQNFPFISWLTAFLLSSLPQYHWLLFHHIAEEIQISSFLKWHHIRLWRSCCCSSSSWSVMSSTFFFFFFISLVYYLKCPAVTLYLLEPTEKLPAGAVWRATYWSYLMTICRSNVTR